MGDTVYFHRAIMKLPVSLHVCLYVCRVLGASYMYIHVNAECKCFAPICCECFCFVFYSWRGFSPDYYSVVTAHHVGWLCNRRIYFAQCTRISFLCWSKTPGKIRQELLFQFSACYQHAVAAIVINSISISICLTFMCAIHSISRVPFFIELLSAVEINNHVIDGWRIKVCK